MLPALRTLLGAPLLLLLAAAAPADVAIDTRRPIAHTAADFLSFNIDAAELRPADPGGVDFPWASARLAARARHLAPHKLRIGGGAQSHSVYDAAFLTQKLPLITALARAMNASLVWGVAPCKKKGNCPNVAALVGSAAAAGIAEWEYGNEPGPKPGADVSLGDAFLSFKKLLAGRFPDAPLIGPDLGYGAWVRSAGPVRKAHFAGLDFDGFTLDFHR